MSIENQTHDFIGDAIAEAVNGHELYGAELHETVYQTIKKDYGVRVGDCQSSLAPLPGGEAVEEFDGLLTLVCYGRVVGPDKTDRMQAREKALAIAKALSKLFLDDPSMGGRVRDARVLRALRGYESVGSQPYAVCNLQLIVNETGQLASERHR
jgi:hypothetical protein